MFSPQKGKIWYLSEVMDVLIDLIMATILQCMRTSNHHTIHLKYIQFSRANYPFLGLEKKLFQGDCYIREQLEQNANSVFAHAGLCPEETPSRWRKP